MHSHDGSDNNKSCDAPFVRNRTEVRESCSIAFTSRRCVQLHLDFAHKFSAIVSIRTNSSKI